MHRGGKGKIVYQKKKEPDTPSNAFGGSQSMAFARKIRCRRTWRGARDKVREENENGDGTSIDLSTCTTETPDDSLR